MISPPPHLTSKAAIDSTNIFRAVKISAALDQWRGFAMALVLVSHGFKATGHVEGLGRAGVNLFFFISGLLIYKSLKRIASQQYPLFKEFYRRRFRRLFPAMAVYLTILVVLAVLTDLEVFWQEIAASFFWVKNYYITGHYETHHLWSISCEMQFYLLAPILFILIQSDRKALNFFCYFLLALSLSGGVASVFGYSLLPLFQPQDIRFTFGNAAWPMLLGFCVEHHNITLKRWLQPYAGFALPVAALAVFTMMTAAYLSEKYLAIGLAAGLVPVCLLMHHSSLEFTGMPGRSMQWLGSRTYSIYLWQQMFTLGIFKPFGISALGIVPAIVLGAVSFSLLERRLLNRRVVNLPRPFGHPRTGKG